MAKCARQCCVGIVLVISLCLQKLMVNGQAGSLGFYLNGMAYTNGSTVLRTDIGEGDTGLQCTTDSTTCCSNTPPEMRAGEFELPDGGGLVPIRVSSDAHGYYRDRGSRFIRLNRLPNGITTGQFGCVIPDASGTDVSLFINVVDIAVSITTFGSNSSGERYSLECSAAVNGSTDQAIFTWLDPVNNEVPLEMINSTDYTSTLTFDPLSISHAGTYTCRVTLDGLEKRASLTVNVETGVFLSLRGAHVPNNSNVDVNEIGAGGSGGASDAEGLLCLTDKVDCCGATQVSGGDTLGQWIFPNGTVVEGRSANVGAGRMDFFFRNRFQSVVRLLRVGHPIETGVFRCEVPNVNNVNQTLYVNVVNIIPTPTTTTFLPRTTAIGSTPSPTPSVVITVSITSSGINTAGGIFNIQCSTMISGSTDEPTFTWLSQSQVVDGDGTKTVSPTTVNPNSGYSSTLSFNPLLPSDAGLYTCRVMVGRVTREETIIVTVNDPVVQISDGSGISQTGQNYTLTCTIAGTVNLTYTLQWRRNGAPLSETGAILSFSPLRLSDAGQYTCEVMGDISAMSDVFNVTLQVPTPMVSVTGPDSSMLPYNGTVYNLTGAVQLDMSVVNTDVVAAWVWSLGGETLIVHETMSPPHQSIFTFRPLATNSSGEYCLSVMLRSLDNADYIAQNSQSTTYSISVLPLPDSPPSVSVISRHSTPDDICGEAMSLSCTANQVENLFTPPIITWIDPRGNQVSLGGDDNPRVETETRNLIFSDVTINNRGVYTCRAVINIPEALINNYFDDSTTSINTIFPGGVENLNCAMSPSPNDLSFSWDLPTLLGGEVIDYRVEVNKLRFRQGTRDVVELVIADYKTNNMTASITQGLEPEVPYNVTVKALNSAGCGEERQIYCFTQEGEPPAPRNVTVVRFDSTTIGISWVKFSLVELKGLASYVVTYDIIISSRKRQLSGSVTVPWTNNTVIISNLQAGAQYDVTVQTSTSAGMSAPVRVRTVNEPESTPDNSITVIAIVCGVVAVVIVLAVAAIVIAVLRYAMKVHRRKILNLATTRSFDSPFMMTNEFYESSGSHLIRVDTIDNGYETLDKYGESYANPQAPQPYLEIEILQEKPSPQQPQLSSAVGVAQCPLYASATFDGSVGKTSDEKQKETSFSQPENSSGNSELATNQEEERYVISELQDGYAEAAYATIR